MPESATKAINRRKISNTNNGGGGNDSKTTRRCRPGTYNARWAGFGSTSFYGGTTFMCVATIACCGMLACANGQTHARGTKPPSVPRDNNTSLALPPHPRQSPSPFTYTIRRLNMFVVLSTTASFFLWVSPRSEYGYFSQDKKDGSGWPADRRGHARIGSQGYQSAEDK